MTEIVIRARCAERFRELQESKKIAVPLNRYWKRYLPGIIYVLGDDLAVCVEDTRLIIKYRDKRLVRKVSATYIWKGNSPEIRYFL